MKIAHIVAPEAELEAHILKWLAAHPNAAVQKVQRMGANELVIIYREETPIANLYSTLPPPPPPLPPWQGPDAPVSPTRPVSLFADDADAPPLPDPIYSNSLTVPREEGA